LAPLLVVSAAKHTVRIARVEAQRGSEQAARQQPDRRIPHSRCAMRDARCAMRDARCAMRDAGCGMRDAGCGMRD
jgi:hypothetical protein